MSEPTPATPITNCLKSKSPSVFTARDKISIAEAILTNDPATPDSAIFPAITSLRFPPPANAFIINPNSANNTPIAATVPASLPVSIKDITKSDAAKIPIALAIFNNAFAFNIVWYSFSVSRKSSKILFTLNAYKAEDNPPKANALINAVRFVKSALLTAFVRVVSAVENAFNTPLPRVFIADPIAVKHSPILLFSIFSPVSLIVSPTLFRAPLILW